jgi:hypothetical protein
MTAGCEGHCGVELTADGWEWLDPVAPMRAHTVERCRLIRTLREAGVRAAPPEAVVTVRDREPEALTVWVSTRTTRRGRTEVLLDVGAIIGLDYAWSTPLDVLGVETEENIRRALANPTLLARGGPQGPVLARDPYAGGSRS